MKRMIWHQLKTIFYKRFVFAVNSSCKDLVAAITIIAKQSMADIFHMHAYLVCASCFKLALNECNVTIPLNHFIIGDRVFADAAIFNSHKYFTVVWVTRHVTLNSSFVIFEIAPNQCNVMPPDSPVEKLF